MAASRLMKWAHFLSAFQCQIEYINTKKNSADWLSRLPIKCESKNEHETDQYTFIHYVAENEITNVNSKAIAQETRKDEKFSKNFQYVQEGWPQNRKETGEDIKKI